MINFITKLTIWNIFFIIKTLELLRQGLKLINLSEIFIVCFFEYWNRFEGGNLNIL